MQHKNSSFTTRRQVMTCPYRTDGILHKNRFLSDREDRCLACQPNLKEVIMIDMKSVDLTKVFPSLINKIFLAGASVLISLILSQVIWFFLYAFAIVVVDIITKWTNSPLQNSKDFFTWSYRWVDPILYTSCLIIISLYMFKKNFNILARLNKFFNKIL